MNGLLAVCLRQCCEFHLPLLMVSIILGSQIIVKYLYDNIGFSISGNPLLFNMGAHWHILFEVPF